MTDEKPVSKCYLITHGMLSAAVAGVQGSHAMHELDSSYLRPDFKELACGPNAGDRVYQEWDRNSNTVVLVSGGNSAQMIRLSDQLLALHDRIPWVPFHEDKETLEGLFTAIAVILPADLANWNPLPEVEAMPADLRLSHLFYQVFRGDKQLYEAVKAIRSLPLVR